MDKISDYIVYDLPYIYFIHSVDRNGAISSVNSLKRYFCITQDVKVIPCDTKKLCHAALLPD